MVRFGTVSLLADFAYEGARSVTGPLLALLGASAAVVGAVTGGVLIVLPVLSAAVPALAFTDSLAPVVLGALVWGAATGVQEATLRAVVADLVAPGRRGRRLRRGRGCGRVGWRCRGAPCERPSGAAVLLPAVTGVRLCRP
ncbi:MULTISPECIES: hypothetical protein [unclassified Streptomyces]|uniref:hypothetical protein n=1 Tax=unclassified Streptomyces TaxID=2593676 RepID=UPI002DD84E04|nr:hypothetical protein [Streptomyces sp. NBC_01445]WSE09397.1 hypothetical protein OG574_42140 [Streptomyces sp. NBC_01445]